ncbi:hypothetical protein PHYSODRAFT_470718, partial [Phytophthora sojae]
TYYSGTSCAGTPYLVIAYEDADCTAAACATNSTVGMVSVDCSSDYLTALRDKFGSFPYLIQVNSVEDDCSTFAKAWGFPASGNCEGSFNTNDSIGVHLVVSFRVHLVGTLEDNGSATMEYYSGSPCLANQWVLTESVDKETLESPSCDAGGYTWYSSDGEISTGSSIIIGIVSGYVVFVLVVASGVFFYVRRRSNGKRAGQWTVTMASGDLTSLETAMNGQAGLWNDDVITAKRVPRDKVKLKKLISRGAYGEVYNGVFNGQQVAVKMLLPSTRGNLLHVTDFLTEAKMTASLDHPHIVTFVGVAWDSLSDLCVMLEFMDGGDLRTLLSKYEAIKYPVGVDREKAIIALHVCHALTYLHSLMPPVIHRDLKSPNILLNQSREATLTDFGVSRERLDQTMTAGVGTSLWMASEVMLGEKYDVKADIFSFGVVLSELDVHTLPYAHAKQRSLDTNGRKLADATLLQKITAGEVRVEFSEASPRSLVELMCACVAVEPGDRPTAAEALYMIQVILSQELAV